MPPDPPRPCVVMHSSIVQPPLSHWHLRSVKMVPKCIIPDTEACKSIALVHENIAIVRVDWMAAACKLLCFAGIILAVSLYRSSCAIAGYEVGRSDLPKGCHWDRALCASGSRRGDTAWATRAMVTYHLWQLTQKVRCLVAKTWRVCSRLVVHMFHAIWEFVQSLDCIAHSRNPEIAHYSCAISRLRNYSAQSFTQRGCADTISWFREELLKIGDFASVL